MLIYHYSTKIHNKWELRKNGAPNCIKIIFIIIKIYFFMRSNVNFSVYVWSFQSNSLLLWCKFVPLRAMMLIVLRRSRLKKWRLVEGKHKKSVIGAWFSDIVKLRTLHYLSRDHAMVMLMGMLYTYLS